MIDLVALPNVVWRAEPLLSADVPAEFPADLKTSLAIANGVVAFGGALHIRGLSRAERWHDILEVWTGSHSLATRYPRIRQSDIPFAENCLGDQFIWRDGAVLQLIAETGELESVDASLRTFYERCAARDPEIWLGTNFLRQFESDGGHLAPGQVLLVYPPLTFAESEHGVSLKAIDALESLDYWSEFARKIRNLPEGAKVELVVKRER